MSAKYAQKRQMAEQAGQSSVDISLEEARTNFSIWTAKQLGQTPQGAAASGFAVNDENAKLIRELIEVTRENGQRPRNRNGNIEATVPQF